PADEQAYVAALDASAQDAGLFVHLDLDVDAERIHDLLEQLAQRLARLQLLVEELVVGVPSDVAHRRRPERFFFLRGGRGGVEVRVRAPTPASAGSPLGEPRGAAGALPSAGAAAPGAPAPLATGAGGGREPRISICWPDV